jgi:hypothetical protein
MVFGGIGLLQGRKWDWWLAVIIFVTNGIGDALRFGAGDFLGGTIGLCIATGLLFYLTRPRVKNFFKQIEGDREK